MQSVQEALREACEDVGDSSVISFRNTYSGRGMYGRQCVGITGDMTDCQAAIAYVVKELSMALSRVAKESVDPDYSATPDDLADTENDFDHAINTLMDFRMDSMGLGVILYWPELEPIEDENLEIDLHDADGDD